MARRPNPAALSLALALALIAGCGTPPPPASIPTGPAPAPSGSAPTLPVSMTPLDLFAPEGGGFKLDLAGRPVVHSESVDLPDGGTMTVRMYSVTDEATGVATMVGYSEFPAGYLGDPGKAAEALANGAEGLAVPLRAEVKGLKSIAIDGHPGREFALEAPAGKGQQARRGLARICLAGDRFYQVCAFGPAGPFAAGPAEASVRSFGLVPIRSSERPGLTSTR